MRLLVDISAHGLGHLAQTGPVLDALQQRLPALQFVLRSGLSRQQLVLRTRVDFEHIAETRDFGFVMHNAVDIDIAASAERYREFHRDWPQRVTAEADWLRRQKIDAVLCNVAYLPLAAAASAGLPSAALCSLNWADMFARYFPTGDWARHTHEEILAAYNAARCFLRVTPGIPMTAIARRHDIAPIARLAQPQREKLLAELALPANSRVILLAMGGMEFRLPIETWPQRDGLIWLVPATWGIQRADVRAFDNIDMHFTDLLASVDAMLTKPGYGSFIEAACNGIPILYLQRDDWPETPYFAAWLDRHARAQMLSRKTMFSGDFLAVLEQLWRQAAPPLPLASGAEQAAELLIRELALR